MINVKNLATLHKLKKGVSQNITKGKEYLEQNIDVNSLENNFQQGKNFIQNNYNKIKNKIQNTNISQLVSVSETELEYDTTHYFLIPDLQNKSEYILLTHREIPKNLDKRKIIKKRVFHVSSEEKLDILKEKFLENEKNRNLNKKTFTEETGDVLTNIANNIDRSNSFITQGLITAGSLVCLINPVTGIALIAGSFVPNFTGEVLSGITNKIASKLKTVSSDKLTKAEEKALKELQQTKPDININLALFNIEKCLNDEKYIPEELNDDKDSLLTKTIASPIFSEIVNNETFLSKNKINTNLKNYLNIN